MHTILILTAGGGGVYCRCVLVWCVMSHVRCVVCEGWLGWLETLSTCSGVGSSRGFPVGWGMGLPCSAMMGPRCGIGRNLHRKWRRRWWVVRGCRGVGLARRCVGELDEVDEVEQPQEHCCKQGSGRSPQRQEPAVRRKSFQTDLTTVVAKSMTSALCEQLAATQNRP